MRCIKLLILTIFVLSCGVSGAGYISSPALRERLERGEVSDVGYDQAPDYEALLAGQSAAKSL